MIFDCLNGEKVDTARLGPEERHVLQKLLAWQSLAGSLAFFRQKTAAALAAGWNDSGPVARTRVLGMIIDTLERDLNRRLKKG